MQMLHKNKALPVAVSDDEVAAGEGEPVVLVPVLQGQVGQRRGVGKLQVGKVPVDDLAVARRQVDVGGRVGVEFLQLFRQHRLLLFQPVELFP